MKSVCIIGAGPGGLVAAKTFLDTGRFEVTVYERKDRIGGIWALDEASDTSFLSPITPTNLSKFTVGFSDLDWNSVDYYNKPNGAHANGTSKRTPSPMFPKAWMANRYLETYRTKYIPENIIHCSCEVVKAHRTSTQWHITTRNTTGNTNTTVFDYLIMASGFFSRPQSLSHTQPSLANSLSNATITTIHTSAFRRLEDLSPAGSIPAGKTILMFGGGNSSGEAAAAVALQLSNAQWSPDQTTAVRFKGCKIVHVMPRPIYTFPHFHEYEEGSRSYVPLDLKLYDFARRPQGLGSYAGKQTMDIRNTVHGFMQTVVGGDQSDISASLVSQEGDSRGTAYVAITESYAEYVRSGLIEVVRGRVISLETDEAKSTTAIVEQDGRTCGINNVGAIINATGYTPAPAFEMLDDDTKKAIEYDPVSTRLPMILEQWQTMSKEVPNLAFIGAYEGPYWPMMEMQARLTAHRWLSEGLATQRWYETRDVLLGLRQAMKSKAIDVPQFWFGDYLGYLQDIANELDMSRNDGTFSPHEGCTSPARYVSESTNRAEADSIMIDLCETWHDCIVEGKYVSRAAFRAMHGNWKISRRIESALPTFPSGTLEGIASFHPRFPTADKSGMTFDFEYLYIEAGTFTTSTGYTMTASRRYVYRYSEAEDKLSVWFVKPDKPLEVDYLFHDLSFVKPDAARDLGACVARADHLCVKDMYWTEYRLPLKGTALTQFEASHTVRGPEKDYVMTTKYERPQI